nr:Retrovirus-related Pol polyprotein from transposon TNT 1-94 [Ipomoea batatas]
MATPSPTDSSNQHTNPIIINTNDDSTSTKQSQHHVVPFDVESPYYLHSSDGTGITLVGNILTGIENYNPWARAVTMPLKGRNKFCFVDGSLPMPDSTHPDHARWNRVNHMVMSWLLNSIHSSLAHIVLYAPDATSVWTDLKDRFFTSNGPRIYDIEKRIATSYQNDASIADYHNQLSALWDELNMLDPPPKCSCAARHTYIAQIECRRLMQFLMGLRETFAQLRSQLLLNENLPTVKNAYNLLLQDESQRLQSSNGGHSTEHSALQTKNTLHPQFVAAANLSSASNVHTSSSTSRSNNNRSRTKCAHCRIPGHTQQFCYKLHGYPPGHKFYKKGNPNSQPMVTPSTSSEISSDSIQHLLRLLREVKEPKANLVGQKAYRLYDLDSQKILVSRDVIFYETIFPFKNDSTSSDQSTLPPILPLPIPSIETHNTPTTTPLPENPIQPIEAHGTPTIPPIPKTPDPTLYIPTPLENPPSEFPVSLRVFRTEKGETWLSAVVNGSPSLFHFAEDELFSKVSGHQSPERVEHDAAEACDFST